MPRQRHDDQAPHQLAQQVGEITKYLQLASDRFGWGVPVLACVPYGEDLDKPSVKDLAHVSTRDAQTRVCTSALQALAHSHHPAYAVKILSRRMDSGRGYP